MNILIIGCGRVGSNLAIDLCQRGHDVSILDSKHSNLEQIDSKFTGLTFIGVPIDNDDLMHAGITSCDVVCAVTDDDNVNIMASQLAMDVYKVPIVICRIMTPEKEDIYQKFGLKTVCSTNITIDAIASSLDAIHDVRYIHYGSSTIKFYTMDLPEEYVGGKVLDIEFLENEMLYAIISRDGVFKLVTNFNIPLERGDKLIFSKIVD